MAKTTTAGTERADVLDLHCPSRAALQVVGNKWALLIVTALVKGPLRNSALLRGMEGISQKVLTQTLRELERNGLVLRTDHGGKPPHVEYALSASGHSLSEALVAVDRWAEAHHQDLAEARDAFDARAR
jgi:DNA-binding HxlR family transcriptional regulator